jgi:hypothetical protein
VKKEKKEQEIREKMKKSWRSGKGMACSSQIIAIVYNL